MFKYISKDNNLILNTLNKFFNYQNLFKFRLFTCNSLL